MMEVTYQYLAQGEHSGKFYVPCPGIKAECKRGSASICTRIGTWRQRLVSV